MVRRTRKRFSLSRATRSSSGKGKPRLASFHKGSPVAARYRPPASATGPALILVLHHRRLRSEDLLRRCFSVCRSYRYFLDFDPRRERTPLIIRSSVMPLFSRAFARRYPFACFCAMTFAISWASALGVMAPAQARHERASTLQGILIFPAMLLDPFCAGLTLSGILEGGVLIGWAYVNSRSVLLAQLIHVNSTGSLVVFSPAHASPAQEARWYAVYGLFLWVVVLVVVLREGAALRCPPARHRNRPASRSRPLCLMMAHFDTHDL
jgi:hypothetical protein